jgi:hypothetical protein
MKKIVSLFVFSVLVVVATPVYAVDTLNIPTSLAISGGGIHVVSDPASLVFAPVTLTGTPQVTNATLNKLTILDASGSGSGWHVSVSATPLTDGVNTFPINSMSIDDPSGISTASSSPSPTLSTGGVIDNGAVTLASAAIGEGMGEYDIEFGADSLNLAVGSTAVVGSYTGTMTVTVSTGP